MAVATGKEYMTLRDSEKRVTTLEEAQSRVKAARAEGKTIVSTNGCFDIIHAGHVACIEIAKGYGDFLVVGVNTDESVRRLKGPGRPVNPLDERMLVLAGLRAVDVVCSFPDDTSVPFVRAIGPDVHVKGGDYAVEDMPEAKAVAEVGGRIELAPLIGGRSTTNLLDKINDLFASGRLP
jgi:rfaE bifunctional protein nucleotidyltransferase chain/domain